VLATGEVYPLEELGSAGLVPEGWESGGYARRGKYAQVLESGRFPRRIEDNFARRLTREDNLVERDSALFRLRGTVASVGTEETEASFTGRAEGAEEDTDEADESSVILSGEDEPESAAHDLASHTAVRSEAETEDEPAWEDTEAESFDLDRAVQLNRQYAQSLGWQAHFDRIVRFLGFVTYTPDERMFAEAAARWQRSQGLSGDGIIGPTTWARMSALLGLTPTQPAAPSTSVVPGGVALTNDQIRVVAQTQWETHPAIHRHFGNQFARYLELWPLYNSKGIQNPANYIVTNIVTVSFFGHRSPAHRDMIAPLQQAENTLRARGITPSVLSFWSFNPRPIRGTTSSLSQHAFGRAVDINPEGNPLIADRRDIQVIEAVTGVNLGRGQPVDVMRNASLTFRSSFNQQWIDQLQQQMGQGGRQQLLQAIQERRSVLDSYARTGFFNLEQPLVDALIEAGLQWGGSWERRKDFMHFELGGK
jgi:hypothetical protein